MHGGVQRTKVKEEEEQETSKRHKKDQEDERVHWKKDGWREAQVSTGWGTAASASTDEESILKGTMAVVHKLQKDLEEAQGQKDRAEKKATEMEGAFQKIQQENQYLKEAVRDLT